MKQTKIDTLFKAQTRRMTPYLTRKQKPNNGLPRTAQRKFLQNQFANTCHGYFGFRRLSVFRLARHFCTALLVDTILIPYLRITLRTHCSQGQKRYPIKGSRTSKTLPYPAAHTYLTHIWKCPPPGVNKYPALQGCPGK